MFDFAFSELVVVLLVALIVIGPEKLPKLARTAGHLWGRMQRYLQSIKTDIENDLAIEEAKQLNSSIRKEISSIEQSTLEARMEIEQKILLAQQGKSSDDQIQSTATSPATGKPDGKA